MVRAGERFADALREVAADGRNPRLTSLVRRLNAPVRVAVLGRAGVGRRTVTAALAAVGVALASDPATADLGVVVVADSLKPEDRDMLDGFGRPAVVVLNKADAAGLGGRGPLATAHRRAARFRALTGVPTVPMVALLADVVLDDELIRALRVLVDAPAELSSVDAFAAAPHPLSAQLRRRLIATLDRFGIAHAVLALADGVETAALAAHLRRLSQVDRVVEHLDAAAAPLRYHRLRMTITELRMLATQSGGERLSEFLSGDEAVLAAMTAAVHVVEASGARVDRGDDAAAHLRRAVYWRRYGRGPVDALHRACAADITRGSLRLLGRVR